MSYRFDQEGPVMRVTIPGTLVSTNAELFRQQMLNLLKSAQVPSQWRFLQLDFPEARMIDSVALNALVSVIKTAKGKGAQVRVTVNRPSLLRILQFTRLDSLTEVVLSHGEVGSAAGD